MPRRPKLLSLVLLLAALVIGGGALYAVSSEHERDTDRASANAACRGEGKGGAEREREAEAAKGDAAERADASRVGGLFSGPPENPAAECNDQPGHPESFADLAKANSARVAHEVAPGTEIRTGAYRAAISQRARIAQAGPAPTGDASWQPYGDTPTLANQHDYDQTRGSTNEGFVGIAGRTTGFTRDDAGRLYAAVSNGGVWESDDNGGSWRSIGDSLQTQVASGVAWSPAGGGRGTLILLTGDNAYGGTTFAGLGVYRSTDGGAHWTKSSGVPDGVLGFKIVVDPNDTNRVYAATGAGLFRSTDAGASFVNVNLPTGAGVSAPTPNCTGKAPTVKDCFLANMVTDVVVQGPDNANTPSGHGAVMAAVGWRAGTKHNTDGSEQSPGNGMYVSPTGAPGTFTNVDFGKAGDNAGATDPIDGQGRIGRIALGGATGADQDHRVVYALVQDAVKFNGGVTALDVNDTQGTTSPAQSDVLNGVWVSTDFGQNWHQLEGSSVFDNDPTTGSALGAPSCKAPAVISYCPGVQAWYNLWVQPDPTRSTAAGVPTRVALGLEEIWNSERAGGLDGSAPSKFDVIGRYYAGETCTPLTISSSLPVCPAAPAGIPKTTTHPDQHGALFVPDGSGGVTLLASNDGGVYRQHTAAGQAFSNDRWGEGANKGLHTLQPYDAEMAKDGTVYMGLQDNGEAKIDPTGKSYTIYGGDGFFTAVDPDHSDIAYEEYVGGDISVTKDGGKNWTDIQPSGLTSAQFSTPFQMDPADANHLMIGGRDIEETTAGPATTSSTWNKVFDLGTQKHPGDAGASAASDDPVNQLSAVDVRSLPSGPQLATGPKTPDLSYTGGSGTVPGGVDVAGDASTFPPGTTDDHAFRIGTADGDATATIRVSWASNTDDWDLFVYRRDGDTLVPVGSSAQGSTTFEEVLIPNPKPGDYVVRVANYTATGTFDAKVSFAQRTEGQQTTSSAYVGFCGFCDTITQGTPFANGIATNVGGDKPGGANKPDGWHIAKAQGLPSRYITSVAIDPTDPNTVYVTLAGYGRRWAFPGAVGEDTSKVGTGHVFKSTDAGASFTDISGNLPDVPANWSVVHSGQLVVGTDIGVFLSENRAGGTYSVLGKDLPTTPVSTLRLKPGDPDLMVAATYGRGVYTYRFPAKAPGTSSASVPSDAATPISNPAKPAPTPAVCAATSGFKSVALASAAQGLRLSVARQVKTTYTVDVFQQSQGRRVLAQRRVAKFSNQNATKIIWSGKRDDRGRKLHDGLYFVRATVKTGKSSDVRRIALVRHNGRFTRRPDFYAKAGCRLLQTYKLSGPSFGGVTHASLGIAYRMTKAGSATVVVRKGTKVVLRSTVKKAGTKLHRLRLPFKGTRPGDYTVTLTVASGATKQTSKLTSRRL